MNKVLSILIVSFLVLACSSESGKMRKRISFNQNWLFQKTDTAAYSLDFDDSDWRKLSLPHDWAIEGPFDEENGSRCGGLPSFGKAWYRKHFMVDVADKGQIVTVEFDGVMSNSTVYLNGKKIYERPYGYIGFEIDLTPFILFGKENVLAVEVNPEALSSRWYPGAGIYRNVWFETKNPVHVSHWGTYITTPEVASQKAAVHIETTILNRLNKKGEFSLQTSILDSDKNIVASSTSFFALTAHDSLTLTTNVEIKNPIRWDINQPYLYTAVSKIFKNKILVDTFTTTFGVRTIEYTREGFFLNGRKQAIQGVCLHHDLGPLGAAVNYRATQRQLEIMQEVGANAIRTAHNPTSPEQLQLCDEMGLLVMAETFDCWKLPKIENGYNKFWDDWHEQDLRDIIRRDRNHPSIIMWSIGNEVKEQKQKDGNKIARDLNEICHQEDSIRATTAGFNQYQGAISNGLANEIDLVGFNYKPFAYENVLQSHPNWIVYGAETSSCVSSRGVYHLPLKKYDKHPSLQVSSYDIQSPSWAYPPDLEFHFQETVPGIMGEFVWTGFDYLGEPTPYGGKDNFTNGAWKADWPSRSSYFGMVDLCGFKKDRFYLYQSQWTTAPMVHILPHWNWQGTDIKTVPVYCYTNCDEAELFLNGKSLGKKIKGVDKTNIPLNMVFDATNKKVFASPYRLSWNVPYAPGTLEVVAYKDGKEAAREKIVTSGSAYAINLSADRSSISADGEDLSFITVKIVDEDGNFCPMADNLVRFTVSGSATIAAVGNGNAATLEPFQANYRKAFNGLCLLVVKSVKGQAGSITIKASSDKLSEKQITIQSL